MDLFVYGTLMDDALVVQLTGQRFRREIAMLDGYRKEVPPGDYPRIVPDPIGRVQGLLLCGVGLEALRVLDRYEDEGRLYSRMLVSVTVRGNRREAMAYVGIPPLPKNCA